MEECEQKESAERASVEIATIAKYLLSLGQSSTETELKGKTLHMTLGKALFVLGTNVETYYQGFSVSGR